MFQPKSQQTYEQMMRVLARQAVLVSDLQMFQPKSQQTTEQMIRVMLRYSTMKLCRSATCRCSSPRVNKQMANDAGDGQKEPHEVLFQPRSQQMMQVMPRQSPCRSVACRCCRTRANDAGAGQAERREALQPKSQQTNEQVRSYGGRAP